MKGWLGEKLTALGIWMHLDKETYRRFHNVIVPARNGTTQIDHVIVSPFGIFVVETKNYQGWIFGSADQAQWTQSIYGKKHRFQNPLRQNYRHIKCLSDYLDLPEDRFHSVVFFIGDCKLKTELPANVMTSGLSGYIKRHTALILDQDAIARTIARLSGLKEDPSLTNRNHLASLRERHTSDTICPKCGADLVQRTVRNGPRAGQTFIGCSAYPKCRFTRSN
ncbi:MAG: NERD domain-containing protein [Oceanipulchritudo sp.]